MADLRLVTRAAMKALIDRFGCFDAVAETLNARWGGGSSKGTISKKVAGINDWTVADIIALEDASQSYPVTRLLARRLEDRAVCAGGSLLADGSAIAKESGEAIAAILSAEQSCCAQERAQAVAEVDEAMDALYRARARLTGDQTNDTSRAGLPVARFVRGAS